MIGAILGDIVGSRYEFKPIKSKDFDLLLGEGYKENVSIAEYNTNSRFTDDTVMTIAVCKALLECGGDYTHLSSYTVHLMQYFGKKYPFAGYDTAFRSIYGENDHKYKIALLTEYDALPEE